ncbi:MAG: hypothetical protein Kow0059_17240 [Candidatus Sumerlaeia bacterium]
MRRLFQLWLAAGLMTGVVGGVPLVPAQAAPIGRERPSPVVVFTHPDNDPPFAWLDESGAPRGLMVDLWRSWGRTAGMSVQFVLDDPSGCRRRVLERRADVLAGDTPGLPPDSRLIFSDVVLERTVAMFTRADGPVRALDDIASLRVGVLAGTFAPDYMAMLYPDAPVSEYDDARRLLQDALRGGLDVFAFDEAALAWFTHHAGVKGRFRKIDTLFVHKVRAAVLADNVELLSRLNAGLRDIGLEGSRRLLARWTSPPPRDWSPFLWPFATLILAAGLVAILMLMFRLRRVQLRQLAEWRKLREELSEKTIDLRREKKAHREAQDQLKFLSTHDALTVLPTRRMLEIVFPQLAAQMSRHARMMAMLHVDLDEFKKINVHFGHTTGDAVLRQTAERLLSAVRSSDVVARLGGDEFIVVLTNLERRQQAGEVAEKILERLREPCRIHGQTIHLSASIGGSFFPGDGRTLGELLQRADQAMCVVKATGRNGWRFWNEDMSLTPPREETTPAGEPPSVGPAFAALGPDAADQHWPVEEAVGVDDLFDEDAGQDQETVRNRFADEENDSFVNLEEETGVASPESQRPPNRHAEEALEPAQAHQISPAPEPLPAAGDGPCPPAPVPSDDQRKGPSGQPDAASEAETGGTTQRDTSASAAAADVPPVKSRPAPSSHDSITPPQQPDKTQTAPRETASGKPQQPAKTKPESEQTPGKRHRRKRRRK